MYWRAVLVHTGVGVSPWPEARVCEWAPCFKRVLCAIGAPTVYQLRCLCNRLNPPVVFGHSAAGVSSSWPSCWALGTGKAATVTATASKGESRSAKAESQSAKGESQPKGEPQSAKVAELTKSLYYYKKRSRELRRMLEACTSSGVVVTDPFGERAHGGGAGAGRGAGRGAGKKGKALRAPAE